VILSEYKGRPLNGPNDVWVHPDVRCTSPTRSTTVLVDVRYDAAGRQHVYFLSADRAAGAVTEDLEKPNGIIGTPDGKTLYVADIGAGRLPVSTLSRWPPCP